MAFSSFAWIAAVLVFSTVTTLAGASSIGATGGLTDSLIAVGNVGSKSFFTSKNTSTWIDAQEFCNNLEVGMRLASIDSAEEKALILEFLEANYMKNIVLALRDRLWNRRSISLDKIWKHCPILGRQENCLKIQYNDIIFDESCFNTTSEFIWPLCEIQRELPPTTSTTTVAPTTTTPGPSPFECPSEGKHPDPFKCTIFHECIPYQDEFLDYVFDCPEFTNYCADKEICGHPEDCPCDSDKGRNNAHMSDKTKSVEPRQVEPNQFDHIKVEFIGKVGSKNFYTYEKDYTPNLIESLEICHRNGMMLARMESDAERSFMLNYMSLNYYIKYFWLSGMDYGTEDSYYWINSGDRLTRSVAGNGGRHNNCLYLADNGLLYDWSCTKNSNYNMRPLCQTME